MLVLTVLSVNAALAQATTGIKLYALDRKIIMDVANIKSDLRRDGGRDPANTIMMARGRAGVLLRNNISWFRQYSID